MKRLACLLAGAALMIGMAAGSVMATTITGSIEFMGSFKTDTNNLLDAKEIMFDSVYLNPTVAQTGSYAPLNSAPILTLVTYNNLTFNPSTAVSPLWSLNIDLPETNTDYWFNLSSVNIVTQLNSFLSLSGIGTLHIDGYDDTPGTWTFSSTGVPGSLNSYKAGFVANTTPVPEPGTMVLLGFGMLGLAIYGKRRMNKEA